MSYFAFLLIIGVAAATTVPDFSRNIKIYRTKEFPRPDEGYWSYPEAPFMSYYAVPTAAEATYTRVVIDAPAWYAEVTPNAPFFGVPAVKSSEESYPAFVPSAVPTLYAPYAVEENAGTSYAKSNLAKGRIAPLSDLSKKPVIVLIPGDAAELEARLCAHGLACLADVPTTGRSGLYFHRQNIASRNIHKLGVPEMTVKRVALPEGTKLSALVRANYLLLTKEGESDFSGEALKDIGDVEVAGHSIRVIDSKLYKDASFEEKYN